MKRCISIIAVLLTVSTQANAHQASAAEHVNSNHSHKWKLAPAGEYQPPQKKPDIFSRSPAACFDPTVEAREWQPIYDACVYAHRKDLEHYASRKAVKDHCARTACNPSWWDKVKYK